MIDALMVASPAATFLSLLVFIVTYSRVSWYATSLGKAIMAGALATGLLVSVALVRRADSRIDSIDLTLLLSWGSIISYFTVAFVYGLKTRALVKESRHTSRASPPPPPPP